MEQIFHGQFSLYDAAIFCIKQVVFVYLFTICKFLPINCIKLSNY